MFRITDFAQNLKILAEEQGISREYAKFPEAIRN